MSDDYWDGALWVYNVLIANDGTGASDIRTTIVPGAGNEMELLYGMIANLDGTTRTGNVYIRDALAGNDLTRLFNESMTAGAIRSFPTVGAGDGVEAHGGRFFIAGTMSLEIELLAVALSQDARFGVVCRIRGAVPTATETGGGTPVITIATEGVF